MTVMPGLNFNGQTVGTYTGETTLVTTIATLTELGLPDVEDQPPTATGEYWLHYRRDQCAVQRVY
jgi:hypothetical protein